METTHLRLERRTQDNDTGVVGNENSAVLIAPFVCPDYWAYRVIVGETQAVLGFPKFNTIGIGFAIEDDWNTNLPYTSGTDQILDHIWHNAGDGVRREDARAAIEMIQTAVRGDAP